MTIESVPIASLSPDPANARKHGERNLEAIAASLRRFGQQKPIVVDSSGIVRAGNGQLAAAKSLGWTYIKIIRSDLPPSELTAFAIADNRGAELAEWDADVLKKFLFDPEIGDVGFTNAEVEKLMGESVIDNESAGCNGINPAYEVVIECRDEEDQKQVHDRLAAEGYKCRLLTL